MKMINSAKEKMRRLFAQAEEVKPINAIKFSEIDLNFVKQYLYIDFEDDDLLIELLIQSAKEAVLFNSGLEEATELDKSRVAVSLLIMIVSDLYNGRSSTATDTKVSWNPLYEEMAKQIRGSYKGYNI